MASLLPMMTHWLHRFFNALGFYTRIPCPAWVDYSNEQLNRATLFFPLIGYIVASACFAVFYAFSTILNPELAILLSMVFGILLTGAFHEDGFADLCDGFGGGWTQADVLRIMKDSRLGTYGVIGLCSILAIKWQALVSLLPWMFISLLIAHSLSRAWAISLMMLLPYAQEDLVSKSKPIARQWHRWDMVGAWIFAVLPLFLVPWWVALSVLALGALHTLWIAPWYQARLKGYTGDALGAAQQIHEISIYLLLAALLPLTAIGV